MPRLTIQPTVMAQWHELVKDAEETYGHTFSVDLEHYLVTLLQRFVDKPEVLSSVIGLEYLDAFHIRGRYQRETLRDVGDKCLLFSGLFPECADKKHVSINYFVDVGRTAYYEVAQHSTSELSLAKLFDDLQTHFIGLMDVLHTIREMGGVDRQLSLIHAFDLWEHTNSEYAKLVIERHTGGFLIRSKMVK